MLKAVRRLCCYVLSGFVFCMFFISYITMHLSCVSLFAMKLSPLIHMKDMYNLHIHIVNTRNLHMLASFYILFTEIYFAMTLLVHLIHQEGTP